MGFDMALALRVGLGGLDGGENHEGKREKENILLGECPDGFKIAGKCLLLQKALYGLRRASRLWQKKFTARLVELGLRQISEEPCFFVNEYLFLIFFIDDIITFFHPDNRERAAVFKNSLLQSFDVKDLGELKWFLGVRVLRDRPNRKLWLCQDSYIEKITNRFNLPSTPMITDSLERNPGRASPQDIHLFQQKVGSLLYATAITRPDASRAVNKLSEFLTNPSRYHLEAAARVISYLYGTKSLALEYSRDSNTFLYVPAMPPLRTTSIARAQRASCSSYSVDQLTGEPANKRLLQRLRRKQNCSH
jgi:Reverse transcriptase (RNA-dependent DNA polymerase)